MIQYFSTMGMTEAQVNQLLIIMEADLKNDTKRLVQEDTRLAQKKDELEIEKRKLALKEK